MTAILSESMLDRQEGYVFARGKWALPNSVVNRARVDLENMLTELAAEGTIVQTCIEDPVNGVTKVKVLFIHGTLDSAFGEASCGNHDIFYPEVGKVIAICRAQSHPIPSYLPFAKRSNEEVLTKHLESLYDWFSINVWSFSREDRTTYASIKLRNGDVKIGYAIRHIHDVENETIGKIVAVYRAMENDLPGWIANYGEVTTEDLGPTGPTGPTGPQGDPIGVRGELGPIGDPIGARELEPVVIAVPHDLVGHPDPVGPQGTPGTATQRQLDICTEFGDDPITMAIEIERLRREQCNRRSNCIFHS